MFHNRERQTLSQQLSQTKQAFQVIAVATAALFVLAALTALLGAG